MSNEQQFSNIVPKGTKYVEFEIQGVGAVTIPVEKIANLHIGEIRSSNNIRFCDYLSVEIQFDKFEELLENPGLGDILTRDDLIMIAFVDDKQKDLLVLELPHDGSYFYKNDLLKKTVEENSLKLFASGEFSDKWL